MEKWAGFEEGVYLDDSASFPAFFEREEIVREANGFPWIRRVWKISVECERFLVGVLQMFLNLVWREFSVLWFNIKNHASRHCVLNKR